jgi:hypothetical protein
MTIFKIFSIVIKIKTILFAIILSHRNYWDLNLDVHVSAVELLLPNSGDF